MLFALLATAFAGEQVTVVGGLSQELTVTAGAVRQGSFALRNNTAEPLDVVLYPKDYRFTSDGRSEYPEPGTLPGSNAAWVTLGATQVRLPANGVTDVTWSVAVPTNVTDGTHWSVVMVEPMGERFDATPAGRAIGVTTVFRSAIQLVTHVGDAEPEVKFLGRRTERSPEGHALLAVDVGNSGRAWVVPTVWAELSDASGASVARASSTPRRLFPDTSGRFWLDLGALPAGSYDAVVVADGGGDQATGARLPLVWE